jgi:hypothetical protein
MLFDKEKLTYSEAMKALREQASTDKDFTKEHLDDAIDYIDSLEVKRLNEAQGA